MNHVAEISGHRHHSCFGRVSKLAVTAACAIDVPAIALQQLQQLSYFHSTSDRSCRDQTIVHRPQDSYDLMYRGLASMK